MSKQAEYYSIKELASRAEVSRRAIRYYIQRGLLPPAHGAGRGSYYDERHLLLLRQLKEAQRAGATLDEVANGQAESITQTLAEMKLERWTRVPCADGIELNVRSGVMSAQKIATLNIIIQRFLSNDQSEELGD